MRAVRSESTSQVPRRALRITRLFFEILLLCLRRTRLERKLTKNHSNIGEYPPLFDPKLTKNRSWVVMGAQSRFGDASGRARDGFGHPYAAPKSILGRPGRAKSGQEPSQSVPRASHRHSKSIWGDSQDARKRHSHHPTQLKAFADRFLNVFGRCAASPKCVSYRSCQCFSDV